MRNSLPILLGPAGRPNSVPYPSVATFRSPQKLTHAPLPCSALPNDTIHVVEQSDLALRDGMLAFLDGEVVPSALDVEAYRAEVTAEFTRLVTAPRCVTT